MGRSVVSVLQRVYSENMPLKLVRSIEKRRPRLARAMWVTLVYTEYVLILKSLNNEPVPYVDVEEEPGVEKNSDLAESVYSALSRGEERYYAYALEDCSEKIEEIRELVKVARETQNYDYLVAAAHKVNEVLGTKDEFVEIPRYRVSVSEILVPREEAERIVELGERIADIFAKLGGRAEAELQKLIFSGYKEGIVDTIDGLSDEEKRFLKTVLEKPLHRASLIFAYKRIGNYRKLLVKLLYAMYFRNVPYMQYF